MPVAGWRRSSRSRAVCTVSGTHKNGKLYKRVLAPGLTPAAAEKDVTTVLKAPSNIPLYGLRWPIQFESKGTSQTNDVDRAG
jgi:hypothetical protein